jgi:hypothetical protein
MKGKKMAKQTTLDRLLQQVKDMNHMMLEREKANALIRDHARLIAETCKEINTTLDRVQRAEQADTVDLDDAEPSA